MNLATKRIAIVLASFSACTVVVSLTPDTSLASLGALDAGYMVLAMILGLPGILSMFYFESEKSVLLKERLLDVSPTLVGCAFLISLLGVTGHLDMLWIGAAFVLLMCFFAFTKSLLD